MTTAAEALHLGILVLPNEPWPDQEARWQRLETAGVDSIWSCDHFTHPHQPGQPWFEGWTALAGLAAATTRVRVGLLVGAIVSRSPMLLAKQAQAVDHISGGRLTIGRGAGGAPTDQIMWGAEDWTPGERAERFAEYVALLDRLTTEDEVSATGHWYGTDGARMAPGFLQRPRPPLLLAAHGRRTLAVAARHADVWNTFGPDLEHARELSGRLDQLCEGIGRDPAEIRRSALLGLTEGTVWTTPAELEDLVAEWHAAGFGELIIYDPPYARAGLPCASPDVMDEVLHASFPRLRALLDRPGA